MKIGDKVRRKPENQIDSWWVNKSENHNFKANKILIITNIKENKVQFLETEDCNCDRTCFELVKTSYFIY